MRVLAVLCQSRFVRAVSRSAVLSSSSRVYAGVRSCNVMSVRSENYTVDIGDMRIKYKDKNETFTEDNLISKEPIEQFKVWFEEACNTPQILEPNAMILATATRDGVPSVRVVLLKGFGTEGFKFYTNYDSRKGRELAENPQAALTFYWESLRRSVRIEGLVKKTSAEDSDRYFQSRPYENKIGSMASKQSSVIASRQTLIVKERELLAQFPENQIKRPACWGGYLVVPYSVEFWQGQSDRLHDRIRFRRPKMNEKVDNILVHKGEDGWVYERLSP
ncbi:PREDICTED: pyridoxine-5'-phosphate oxidase [Wasmannia auropunctata]|uniref:pyridoxine-5'-phosphate oxidase n=1 Tax=Wasmannia auropunctata TaxID=64793 RepID=UPI0005EE983E|nr:PREDICTED: pyridoxine-5'-phosphate oxidase [Wasmannia auropunctata]